MATKPSGIVVQEKPPAPVRGLSVLSQLIKQDIQQGEEAAHRAAGPFFEAAGMKLWEAEQHFATWPEFYAWATKAFHRTRPTIDSWMKYAVEMNGGKPLKFLEDGSLKRALRPQNKEYKTLSEVTHPDQKSHHRDKWRTQVKEVVDKVNVTRMAQEKQSKVDESKLMHELAMKLIDIGYRVLAAKLHPDKRGGSKEAMERLNRVRQILKGAI